jgi:glutaredoxin
MKKFKKLLIFLSLFSFAFTEEIKMEKYHGHELILYWKPGCPYCEKVIKVIKEDNIPTEMRNIQDAKYRKELIEKGGKQQVPCLFIDGKPLYESKDIIDWLRDPL